MAFRLYSLLVYTLTFPNDPNKTPRVVNDTISNGRIRSTAFAPQFLSSPTQFAPSFDHLVHQLRDPHEYVPPVPGWLYERKGVRQSRHPHIFELSDRPSVVLILAHRAQRRR